MYHRNADLDWVLRDLADGVPHTRHVVVTSDGLCVARHGCDDATAQRAAAAYAGVLSLAMAIGGEFPDGKGRLRLVAIEVNGGFCYLMATGPGAYLGVLADEGVDAGLVGQSMRDLVTRIGEHLNSPPRADPATQHPSDHRTAQDE